jgi:pimeloyl-ACP methyl ester carboxylesterase
MPVVYVNDQPLFYFEYRVSSTGNPPVLLIHGAGGQHVHWPPQVRRLPGVRTIAPDLPGHGRSAGPGHDSIAAYAADLLALMDMLEIDRFVAAGHSMGGGIALQLALDAPGRVAGLALIATGAKLRVAPQILNSALIDYSAVVDLIISHAFSPSAGDDLRRLARRVLQETPAQVSHSDYLACDAFDVREALPNIACPALVVGGTADVMTPFKYAQFLADSIPGADLHSIEGGGHMLPTEFPGEVAALISTWLGEHFG